jgi:propanediol dehydratase large subunit
MQDLGYDENDDDADDDLADYRRRARQLLIDSTRKNLEDNLKKAELNQRDVFIVSNNVILSLVTAKEPKKTTPVIDEARLLEAILRMAHARRYGTQASAKNHSTLVKDNLVRYAS